MTPTPEDIALAKQIDELVGCLDTNEAAQLIAAHTAPLRERIKELEQQVEDLGYEIKQADERNPE